MGSQQILDYQAPLKKLPSLKRLTKVDLWMLIALLLIEAVSIGFSWKALPFSFENGASAVTWLIACAISLFGVIRRMRSMFRYSKLLTIVLVIVFILIPVGGYFLPDYVRPHGRGVPGGY